MNLMSNRSASSESSAVRIMVPSSRIISQQSPHSFSPARRHRSTVASVWPFRSNTPFFLASRGNICPGRRKSSALASSSTQAMAVMERSAAEMPVEVEIWSMDTVKAVSWLSVLCWTIWGNCSFRTKASDMGMQIRPLPWVAIKLMFSVVANWAAQMKSPSFSRSGSSVTRMSLPCFRSSRASGMVLNFIIDLLAKSRSAAAFLSSVCFASVPPAAAAFPHICR